MPRRTIVIGRQPAQFDFQDDWGPLNNGLAYAAGQFLAAGRDRAQIETQQQAIEQQARQDQLEREDRNAQRQQDVDFRNQDLELRRKALGFQEEDRKTMRENQAEQTRQQKIRDAADAAAKWRDDMGSVGKYALDWLRGGNPSGAPKAPTGTPASDLNREKFNWERAVQEIGNPEYDIEVVEGTDAYGNPVKRKLERPLSELERKSRVDRINARFNELNGATWQPLPGFQPDQPGQQPQQPQGMLPPRPPVETDATLADIALGGASAPASAPTKAAPSTGAGAEQARNQFMAGAGGWGMFPGANFAAPQAPNEDAIISQRVQALSPDDRAAFNRIMQKGTPQAKAEARARLLSAGK